MYMKKWKSLFRTGLLITVMVLAGVIGCHVSAEAANEIVINGGAGVSNYHQVSLALAPPVGSATMSFRNESLAWSADEAVATSKLWTLSAQDGNKKVSVRFKNGSGTILNPIYSDVIRLDYLADMSFFSPNGSTNYANPNQFNTTANAVAVQPADQKTVVVGTYDNGNGNTLLLVARYNADGTDDQSFGVNGKVNFGNATGSYVGNAVAIQADGKIVVVGTYDMTGGKTGLWLMRLTSTGALDPTFNSVLNGGVGGYLVYGGLTGKSAGNAVTIQPADQKIVVVGTYDRGGVDNTTPWILRFNTNGTFDQTFNFTGEVALTGTAGAHTGNGVAVQADGKIVVAGTYSRGAADSSVWVMRLVADGTSFDTTFGGLNTGYVTYGASGAHTASGVAINPSNGKINVVGTWDWTGGDTDLWLLQLTAAGTLDPTFNTNPQDVPAGTVALGGDGADMGKAVKIQSDGKILVTGKYDTGSFALINNTSLPISSLLVQRFNADGSDDVTFNRGTGTYTFGVTGPNVSGNALALQADGKILVSGMGFGSQNTSYMSSMLTMRLFDHMLPLNVTTVGSGSVTVLPGDMSWAGSAGSATYLPGTIVQLTAVPTGGALFVGWSGACTGTGTCTVTMDAAKNVTAEFSLPVNLTVNITGPGSVSSDPSGVACTGASCTASFPLNTAVTLTAVPAWYSTFGSWSGCDSVVGAACSVTTSASRAVSVIFNQNLTVRLPASSKLYATIHDGYVAADASGSTPPVILQAQVMTYLENLLFNLPVTVTLQGGRDAAFSATPAGFTTVSGSLKVNNGRLNATYVNIKP